MHSCRVHPFLCMAVMKTLKYMYILLFQSEQRKVPWTVFGVCHGNRFSVGGDIVCMCTKFILMLNNHHNGLNVLALAHYDGKQSL